MIRIHVPLTAVVALALATGCAKNKDETENPDTAGDGAVDGDGSAGDDAQNPVDDRARDSTTTRSSGKPARARTKSVQTKKPPRALPSDPGEPEDDGINGLLAEAWELPTAVAVPKDFDGLGAVAATFNVPDLDFQTADASEGLPGMDLTANYAVRFSGSLNIVEEGEYELCLYTDDGSNLMLEDTLLVDNDGVHDEATETCELVYLAPGEYSLQIGYFQADGPSRTVQFAWSVNGGDKVMVPSEVLFKPSDEADETGGR